MILISKITSDDLIPLSLLLEELTEMKSHLVFMVDNFKKISADTNYILLGAKDNNVLVGSLMGIVCHDLVGDCKPFMVIENVIVAKSARGKGIGKSLMHEIETIGRSLNCSYTMFVSGYQRKDAHRFYEAIGYKPDTVRGFKKFLS
jgi:GNAT superfamily N-acetyltransferase